MRVLTRGPTKAEPEKLACNRHPRLIRLTEPRRKGSQPTPTKPGRQDREIPLILTLSPRGRGPRRRPEAPRRMRGKPRPKMTAHKPPSAEGESAESMRASPGRTSSGQTNYKRVPLVTDQTRVSPKTTLTRQKAHKSRSVVCNACVGSLALSRITPWKPTSRAKNP